jgi:hypothetical protein
VAAEIDSAQAQHVLVARRILGGTPALAQVWFRAAVLDRYRATRWGRRPARTLW